MDEDDDMDWLFTVVPIFIGGAVVLVIVSFIISCICSAVGGVNAS